MSIKSQNDSGSSRVRRIAGFVAASPRLALIGLVRVYQLVLSPRLGSRCRFHPSCSSYGIDALRTHGALKGTLLTVGRLGRCNPWNGGGLNPVPERGSWRSPVNPDGSERSLMSEDDLPLSNAIEVRHTTYGVRA